MAHQGPLEHYNLCNIIWSEFDMTGKDLKLGREHEGWTQEEAARRLSVSQPYLSLMEKGARSVSKKLARKAASAFGLSATTLPVETSWETVQPKEANTLAMDFATQDIRVLHI